MGNRINILLSILLWFVSMQNCFAQTTSADILKQILADLKQSQGPEVIQLLENAEKKAQKLEEETNAEIKKLQTEAVDKVKKINSLLEKNIQQIQQETEDDIAQIKKSAQEELTESSMEAKNDVEIINNEFKEEVLNLKKNATLKILEIINIADEQALKIRKTERENKVLSDLQKAIDIMPLMEILSLPSESFNFTPITDTWKISIAKEFDANNALLQQIIIEGEEPEQISDFTKRFEHQKQWFDTTLGATRYFSDQNYNKIINKNSQLDQVATAIKKSNAILETLELSSEQKKQIRLISLYEINSAPKPISDEKVRQITLNTINRISGKPQVILESKLAKTQYSKTFEDLGKEMLDLHLTNKELLNKFDRTSRLLSEQNQKTASTLNSQLNDLKKQNKEASIKIDLLGEICDLKIKEQTDLLKKSAFDKPIPSPIRVKEEENRQKLELELEILEKKR